MNNLTNADTLIRSATDITLTTAINVIRLIQISTQTIAQNSTEMKMAIPDQLEILTELKSHSIIAEDSQKITENSHTKDQKVEEEDSTTTKNLITRDFAKMEQET